MTKEKTTGLDLLRVPFPENQISKLPKPTKAQTDAVKRNFKEGIRCEICGGWHHPKVVHLDYVGHAALTDRLLDCDPSWNWEPMSRNEDGSPKFDANGGMWINLTVCGVTRIGYGHPDGKTGGDAFKETIGDALRNAAMRFGAALDLWHKGDLHAAEEPDTEADTEAQEVAKINEEQTAIIEGLAERVGADFNKTFAGLGIEGNGWADLPAECFERLHKAMQAKADKIDEEHDRAVNEEQAA